MLENKLRAKIILWQVLFLVCNHLLKWKSFPFRWRVVQICIYLCTVWFSIIPSNQFFPFQSACLGQMKHSGPRTELLRYLNFLPGVTCIPFEFPYIHCKPHRHVPTQRIWFLRFFVLKTDIHFAHFGLELGVVFERKKRRVSTYLSFQFQLKNKKEKETFANSLT